MSDEPTPREVPLPDAIRSKPDTPPPVEPLAPAEPVPSASPPVAVEREAIDPSEVEATHETLRETPQGTQAPLSTRLVAAVIDGLIAIALTVAAAWILPNFLDRITWLIGSAYWVTRDSLPFLNGQSIGKSAMKLKAVKVAGGDLVSDWPNALVRNVLLIIPVGPLVELIVLLARQGKPEQGRRLGDDWAKTRVIVTPAG